MEIIIRAKDVYGERKYYPSVRQQSCSQPSQAPRP
jgi:hypothetical protein